MVKDLALSNFNMIAMMKFSTEPFQELYNALKAFDSHLDNILKDAVIKSDKGEFLQTQEMCDYLLKQKTDTLNVLILMADACFNLKEYDRSISYLIDAQELYPNCGEVLCNLGSSYWKKGELDKAISYFAAAVTKKPMFIEAWINYANILLEANNLISAERAFRQVLEYKPELHSIRIKYCKVLQILGPIELAQDELLELINYAPRDTDTLNFLGDNYFKNNELEECISCYEEALKLNCNLESTWSNLGKAYFLSENYAQAILSLSKAIKLNPSNISMIQNLAVALVYGNNPQMAVETYEGILEIEPDNVEINFSIALMYIEHLGNFQAAEAHLEKCIELHLQSEDFYKQLIKVYKNLNKLRKVSDTCLLLGDFYFNDDQLEKAKYSYKEAVFFNPKSPNCHWKVGLALFHLEDLDSALSRFNNAIDLDPDFADAYFDCGLIYEQFDDSNKAIEYYEKAIGLNPRHSNYLHNMSSLKLKLGKFDEAVDCLKKMLECDNSDYFDVHLDLANILYKEMKNPNDALFYYEKALTYEKSCVYIYVTMGNILFELKKNDEAIICFNKAILQDPLNINAYISLSSVYEDSGRYSEAIKIYKTALKLESDFRDNFYCKLVLCLQKVCDWSNYDSDMKELNEIMKKQLFYDQVLSLLPQDCLLLPLSIEVKKQITINYSKQCVAKCKNLTEQFKQFVHEKKNLSSNEPLRIGFVSTNFNKHPISTILHSLWTSSPVLNNEVEVFCYASSPTDSNPPWMNFLISYQHYRSLSGLEVYDAARIINGDRIHILVDLNTNNKQTEIFAFRPAPVQVSWIGYYPCTIGATYIDYLITDKVCSPNNGYIEKLAYVKETVFVGDHKEIFNDLSVPNYITNSTDTRQMYNLPEGVVVFCNFNKPNKINPYCFKLWLTILTNVPNSVLWLLRWNNDAEINIKKFAENLDFNTSRIIFSDIVPKNQHMRRIHLADICLDTVMYNGHMTCLDAIWAGIPVITLIGKTYAARVTASQLFALGYESTIASNSEEYILAAIKCGLDSEMLINIKNHIQKMKMSSSLFDTQSYAIDVVEILKNVWTDVVKVDV